MYKIISNTPKNDMFYQKWKDFYEPHVRRFFDHLLFLLDRENILYMTYDFETFCTFVYNKSSKRIPLY